MNQIKLDKQLFLVKFPIFFPIFYGLILYFFPNFETELIILTILLLAETHFGATWPFLIDKHNSDLVKKYKINLIAVPFIILIFSVIGFFVFNKLFLLIFFASNMYHVTRQSFGIGKLYCKDEGEKKFQEKFIYFFNILFFIVGYLRFYIPVIDQEHLLFLNLTFVILLIFVSYIYIRKYNFSDNFLVFLTGCLIFFPICFVNNPVHAIIMGVTMHYTQYLYLTFNVSIMRNDDSDKIFKNILTKKSFRFILIIIVYSIFMSIFSLFGKYEESFIRNLIIIPIIGQMLHFYLDSQLWKFSDKLNRENTLKYLIKVIR